MVSKPTNWILSFCDLLTLLVASFVFIVSLTSMDAKKLQETLGFFQAAVGNLNLGKSKTLSLSTRPNDENQLSLSRQLRIVGRVSEEVLRRLRRRGRQSDGVGMRAMDPRISELVEDRKTYRVAQRKGNVELELSGEVFFEPSTTNLREETNAILTVVRDAARGSHPLIRIEVPVLENGLSAQEFSAWDLAAARSTKLVRLFDVGKGLITASVVPANKNNFVKFVYADGETHLGGK